MYNYWLKSNLFVPINCLDYRIFILMLLAVACVSLSGCAVTATGEKFSLTKQQSNKAVIYHYREDAFKGSAFSYDILSNEKPLTRLGNGGYYKEVIEPGSINYRTLLTQDKGIMILDDLITNSYQEFEQAFSLDTEPNKVYFLKWTPNIFGGPPEIEIVDQNDALGSITELRAYPPAQTLK